MSRGLGVEGGILWRPTGRLSHVHLFDCQLRETKVREI